MARWLAIILPTFLLTCSTVLATPLTLEEALQKAKQQHPLLQTVQWDQAIAQASRRQADSGRYPQLDAQGGYTAQLDPQAMQVAGQSMETQQASYTFASLALTQTLYDFGRRDARQKQAQYGLKAVQSDIRSQEQEVVLQVIQTYFGLLEGEKLVLTAEQELRSVEEHRRVAQTLYEHGSVTRNDLLQAEVRHASSHQKLLASRNRLANLQLQLNFLIGSAPDQRYRLAEPPLPTQPSATPPALTEALESRPDLAALRSQLEISEQQVRASRAAFYPELYARLSLDYLENERLREQTIYAATVGLKVNLFDGFASSAGQEKAIASRSRVQQQLRMAEQQARLEIATARNDLQLADQQIAVTREAIRQGEENLRINKDRYQERVGTASDVLDAQSLLTQVKTEHYRALYDFQVARARLNKALGLL